MVDPSAYAVGTDWQCLKTQLATFRALCFIHTWLKDLLCASVINLRVSVVKLPQKTLTTEAQRSHRDTEIGFSDRLLKPGVNNMVESFLRRSRTAPLTARGNLTAYCLS